MEPEIIQQLRKNNATAQQQFYTLHAKRMFLVALRYAGNEFDASTIISHAFMKTFSKINHFKWNGEGSIEAWLRRIVVNESLMLLRANKKEKATVIISDRENKIAAKANDLLEEQDYLNMIRCLPSGYRTVFNLSVIEGYSHEEIAQMLSISQETSRSQLSRARALLRDKLKDEA